MWLAVSLVGCVASGPVATATLQRPTPRPTLAFPLGTPVPVTSADDALIENEPGPIYVILSTVDEHGLTEGLNLRLVRRPDPADDTPVARVPTGTFAQVLEIRRLPPDYLRSFYRVRVEYGVPEPIEGWVADWYARRTVFVVEFDAQGCACIFPVQLWADDQLTQPAGSVTNRSPLRLIALAENAVQVQAIRDGTIGWLDRDIVHESDENEFLKYLAP